MDVINAMGKVLPSVFNLVGGLMKLGHSADEAAEIAKRDIDSRAAEYGIEKAADDDALERKHGR